MVQQHEQLWDQSVVQASPRWACPRQPAWLPMQAHLVRPPPAGFQAFMQVVVPQQLLWGRVGCTCGAWVLIGMLLKTVSCNTSSLWTKLFGMHWEGAGR